MTEQNDLIEKDQTEQSKPSKPSKSKGVKYEVTGNNVHSVAGKSYKPGDKVELTSEQQKDERLMAKIETSVRCGRLKAV